MTDFIIKNRLIEIDKIKAFTEDNYAYNESLSSEKEWVFSR
jgi:cytoplasmic iron level regulating protein YaaA (DUF328/UPF0246 family)